MSHLLGDIRSQQPLKIFLYIFFKSVDISRSSTESLASLVKTVYSSFRFLIRIFSVFYILNRCLQASMTKAEKVAFAFLAAMMLIFWSRCKFSSIIALEVEGD